MEEILLSAFFVFTYLTVIVLFIYQVSVKSDYFCSAPGLDIAMASLTIFPWFVLNSMFGIKGFIGSLLGQILILSAFINIHEMIFKVKEPTIKRTLNEIIGPVKNHIGLFISLLALPVLWSVRIGEIIIWPLLVWTLNFPKYNSGDWVNVSRHKINGMTGHDMVWCLYCDWMTGIYSFGAEMLRNVESFWCPIKFYSSKKCENCKIDFPDIEKWVPSSGSKEEVAELLLNKYPPGSEKERGWFDHPSRNN